MVDLLLRKIYCVTFCCIVFMTSTLAATCLCSDGISGRYECEISDVIINQTNQALETDCFHIEGRSNDDVVSVVIQSTEFHYMTNSIFETFSNLVELTLTYVALAEISPADFTNCNLKSLTIINSNLRVITSRTFAACTDLESLTIGGSILRTIEDDAFAGLASLQELIIHNVQVLLWTDFFRPIENLRNIIISYYLPNERYAFPNSLLHSSSKLEVFTMTFYMAEQLPSNFFQGSMELTNLSINTCSLPHIDAFLLQPLGALEYLDLTYNSISTIHRDAFKTLVNLKELTLVNNRITNLDQTTFMSLRNLVTLNLKDNMDVSISAELFKPLVSLENLNLSDTRNTNLTSLTLQKLKTLDLTRAWIRNINESTFEMLPSLEVLIMSYSHLNSLPSNLFRSNRRLKLFDISWNALKTIDTELFMPIPELEHLDMSRNLIFSINPAVAQILSRLKHLDLRLNPCLDYQFSESNMTTMADSMQRCFQSYYEIIETTTETTNTASSKATNEDRRTLVSTISVILGVTLVDFFLLSCGFD